MVRWSGFPFAAILLLVVSRQTLGFVSVASFLVGWTLLLTSFPILYWRLRKAGRLGGRRGNVALAITVSLVSLQLLLSLGIALRGEFHRTHSHRDDNVAFHPVLGHSPVLLPESEAAGLVLAETIGQRLRTIDTERAQIVIAGDSVLYGWRLDDAQVVDALLAPDFPDYQVLNVSVSGYSIAQYYLYLKEHLRRTRPKVVVVGICAGNDYESSAMSNWSGHSTPLFELDGDGLRLYRPEIPRFNCVDVLSGSLLFKPLWQRFDLAMEIMNTVCNVRTLEEPEHGEVVHLLLKAIEALVQEQGARLLYVLLPDVNDFDPESWYVKEKSRLPQLRAALIRGGYDWVDIYEPLSTAATEVATLFLPEDSAHLSAAGMRLLATTLSPRIHLLLDEQ